MSTEFYKINGFSTKFSKKRRKVPDRSEDFPFNDRCACGRRTLISGEDTLRKNRILSLQKYNPNFVNPETGLHMQQFENMGSANWKNKNNVQLDSITYRTSPTSCGNRGSDNIFDFMLAMLDL